MELRWPGEQELPSYVAALERGWSPSTVRAELAADELESIRLDPIAFLTSLVDREGSGPAVVQPDGSTMPRIPGYRKWMWDGEFCGSISLRWVPGTAELPSHVLGHVGYSVVPWKRRLGYATAAVGLVLDDAREEGLEWVELTTELDNVGSRRVIEANGGELVGPYPYGEAYQRSDGVRYRITL